jgi:predicted transcriptional regulator
MVKRTLSVEIPDNLVQSLDETAKRSGRKKNLLLAAALSAFLKASESDQEKVIKKYLDMNQ